MEAVGKGARLSKNWTGDQVIGLIPEADDSKANPYLDVIMPTGLGLFRNTLVAQCAENFAFLLLVAQDSLRNCICLQLVGAAMSNSGGWSEKLVELTSTIASQTGRLQVG